MVTGWEPPPAAIASSTRSSALTGLLGDGVYGVFEDVALAANHAVHPGHRSRTPNDDAEVP